MVCMLSVPCVPCAVLFRQCVSVMSIHLPLYGNKLYANVDRCHPNVLRPYDDATRETTARLAFPYIDQTCKSGKQQSFTCLQLPVYLTSLGPTNHHGSRRKASPTPYSRQNHPVSRHETSPPFSTKHCVARHWIHVARHRETDRPTD
jgi:hypothetical protein